MNVIAPGKVLVSGAYAVLRGAPAIVVAVDRYAIARAADDVDSSALYEGDAKLGLGSSAAYRVAGLGYDAAARGEDVEDAQVRRRIFDAVRDEHARAQSGGSGVDVAASVYGGVLRYRVGSDGAVIAPLAWPAALTLAVFWSGTSARTPELRARVDALRARDPSTFARRNDALSGTATAIADAVERADALRVVEASIAASTELALLGAAADAPIVTPAMARLGDEARARGAAFLPSGAGGGDIAIWLAPSAPDARFVAAAAALGMHRLMVEIDQGGVRMAPVRREPVRSTARE